MNLVSLLILPAVINLQDNGVRFVIAGVALVVLLGAIAFSKRRAPGMDATPTPQAAAEPVSV